MGIGCEEREKHVEQSQLRRSALRYYGGKWRIAPQIIQYFPPHTCYVEPYGGAASVLLKKSPSEFEVFNDLNGDIVNFFQVLRSQPQRLIRAIELTPYSRVEHEWAYEPASDPIERARRFYVRSWQSFGSGEGETKTGWRIQKNPARRSPVVNDWNRTHHLWAVAKRFKQVQIEADDGVAIIKRFDAPGTLFYVDPPYPHSTRSPGAEKKGYAYEMTDDQHRELARILQTVRGMVIISGYDCPMYRELYGTWRRVEIKTRDRAGKSRVECLWLSPSVAEANQQTLFSRTTE